MKFHLFWTVARYEMKTLFRSWFFRIFAIIATLVITSFNLTVFLQNNPFFWIYKALGGSLPYANLLLVNLGQAIVAIFLASEFLKQDQKNDSVEVIYVRPITNSIYVLGKFTGILVVFALFNLFILLLGIGYSFIGNTPVISISALLIYPLLISMPTLVFIIGLSFSLMVLVRNQAIVFILLLGYIALSVFYLNNKFYHVFDYIAYNVPMLYSSITGFGNLSEVLIHRGIYLLLGVGLIFFTIYKLKRLPEKDTAVSAPLLAIFIFIIAGAAMGFFYIQTKRSFISFRKEVITLNNQYADGQGLSVVKCDIDLRHKGRTIEASAILELENKGHKSIDTVILSLNPSLSVEALSIDSTDVGFKRELHLIKIPVVQALQPAEKCVVKIIYQGELNENYAFVDLNEDEYNDVHNFDLLKMRKRTAFINSNFVCLTSASGWYPTAGAGYSTIYPYFKPKDFSKFSLRVRTDPDLLPISQGLVENFGEGDFKFTPEYPLSQISLSIGNYVKKSVTVDSIEFSIYTIRGNDFYTDFFEEIKDTLAYQIKDLWSRKKMDLGIKYPYARFSIVEVPVHFRKDVHKYSIVSDAVQPEIIYYPEKGIGMENVDLKAYMSRYQQNRRQQGGDIPPDAIKTQAFKDVLGNFLNYYFQLRRTYDISPQFYAFSYQLHDEKRPVLNLVLQAYLKNLHNWQDYNKMEAKRLPVKELVVPGLEDNESLTSDVINTMILDKGVFLFKSLGALVGEKEFDEFLRNFISINRYKSVYLNEFDSAFTKTFDRSIEPYINNWYKTPQLPAYVVRNVKKFKPTKTDGNDHLVSFEIANINPSDGFIDVLLNSEERQVRWEGKFYIPGSSAKKIILKRPYHPIDLRIQTYIAENIPNEILIDLSMKADEILSTNDTVYSVPFFTTTLSNKELIVDNEDEGFSITSPGNKGFLKKLVEKNKNPENHYENHIWYWNPPSQWTKVLETGNYGQFIHSAIYTSSGNGEMQAFWKSPVSESGYYNIYFYYYQQPQYYNHNNRKTDYNITVYHDGGIDQIKRYENEFSRGWNLLGSYYISSDTAKVMLSNKSEGRLVIGDAIKWEKVN